MEVKKRLERIVHIFFLLQSRAFITNKELQERFHIGRRTVYRDLKVLEQAGVPVVNEGEGFSIMEGFRMQPSRFSQEEVLSLMIAEKIMQKHETDFVKKNFETALIKIKSSFQVYQKDHVSSLDDKLQISEPFKATEYLPNVIDLILSSILKKKIAAISYLKSGTDKAATRNIEAVGVFHEHVAWYVLAWCHLRKDYRNFRLDRIKKITLTTEDFTKDHKPIQELRATEQRRPATPITISADRQTAHFLFWERELYGFKSEEEQGDELLMHFNCRQHPISFVRWFMRFVDVASIVAPVELKEEVREVLENGMRRGL
jgi:predicted DNA-binding transcriptional regulator YafY